MALSEREKVVLDIERGWWLESDTKQATIRARLHCSPATYYSALRRLVDSSEAREYDPLLIARLRRRHEAARRARLDPGPAARHRPR